MKVIVLDTNILIDNVHGYAIWVDQLFEKKDNFALVIPTIVIAEYLAAKEEDTKIGSEKSKNYLALFKTQDFTYEIAEILGRILRRKTHPADLKVVDLMVASTALYLGAELATRNKRDFAKIPNLRFFDPDTL